MINKMSNNYSNKLKKKKKLSQFALSSKNDAHKKA